MKQKRGVLYAVLFLITLLALVLPVPAQESGAQGIPAADVGATRSTLRHPSCCSTRPGRYVSTLLPWSWLVGNVYEKGDGTTNAGDDFPLRIHVLFE